MSITDNVINIALLGTANREMTSGELPEDLAGTLERVKENATDGEEVFYKGAAAFFAYYRSGLEPLKLKESCSGFRGWAGNAALCRSESGCDTKYFAGGKVC